MPLAHAYFLYHLILLCVLNLSHLESEASGCYNYWCQLLLDSPPVGHKAAKPTTRLTIHTTLMDLSLQLFVLFQHDHDDDPEEVHSPMLKIATPGKQNDHETTGTIIEPFRVVVCRDLGFF